MRNLINDNIHNYLGIESDGTFLVRSSTACLEEFVLSFIYKKTIIHFQIKYHSHIGGYSLINNSNLEHQNIYGLNVIVFNSLINIESHAFLCSCQ